jgi:hypothetical protein
MKTIKIKPFIYVYTGDIKGIAPIRSVKNKYGVTEKFAIINNQNLNVLREQEFLPNFKDNKDDDFLWFLDRWAVAIVSNDYLLNRFLAKDEFELYKLISDSIVGSRWTKTTVVVHG